MKEDGSFDKFYTKLNDLRTQVATLVKKIPKSRTVRKIMRSLLERFKPKAIAIEENKNLDFVKIEYLLGSLQTYELLLPQPKKGKSIFFKKNSNGRCLWLLC